MIRTGIQSYWFKPLAAKRSSRYRGGYPSIHYFLTSWILSAHYAKQQFSDLRLFTDSLGARCAEILQLPYVQVDRLLDELTNTPEELWACGKMLTISYQHEPFVHLDCDVVLVAPLPQPLLNAPVMCQQMEVGPEHWRFYGPAAKLLVETFPGEFPHHETLLKSPERFAAANCGIVGGADVELLTSFARRVATLMSRSDLQPGWKKLFSEHTTIAPAINSVLEQVILVEVSQQKGVELQRLIGDGDDASPGFIHPVGPAKFESRYLHAVENEARRVAPHQMKQLPKALELFN